MEEIDKKILEKIPRGVDENGIKKMFDSYKMIKHYKKTKKVVLAAIKKGPKIGEVPLDKKTILLLDLTEPIYIEDLRKNPNLFRECLQESAEELAIKQEWFEETAPQKINEVLQTLTPREEKVIRKRFGIKKNNNEPETLDLIGKNFGVCREAIRQTEKRAIQKLRNPLRSRKLRPLLVR